MVKLFTYSPNLLILIFLIISFQQLFKNVFPQAQQSKDNVVEHLLTPADSLGFTALPHFQPMPYSLKTPLPYYHDNASEIYFRPLFEQVSNECGQYAAIALVFTYEMNYARNTPANSPENQYPTHYTYNFMNGGFGWFGVSYFHSFEIVKLNGHPNVPDFGTLNSCGPAYWMSGYEKYLNGMSNRIDKVYQIRVKDEEGLLTLKNWLHNHGAGDETGGIACFYSGTPFNTNFLPENTPEGGKHVMTQFFHKATHSSTITGYNDSIRFDYNQDGQFTNHIDINDDGKVDMKDWEIGGLRFTDSYLGGVNWADSGFCYMMYKTLADELGEGGIWNHSVHIVTVKEDYSPLISLKADVIHNCRNRIRILAGVSGDPSDTVPEYTMGFPVFDYQGGCQHMQGGYDPDSLNLELGLDITPLLGKIQPGVPARFFMQLLERDPENYGSGMIKSFSIVDHTDGDNEYQFPGSEMEIINDGVTIIGVEASINFNEIKIVTDQLPTAFTNEYYEQQLEVEGGQPPYTWSLVESYQDSVITEIIPVIDQIQLELPDTIHSQVLQVLDFEFPFYRNYYDSVWVHTDGFIMFDDQVYPWPYLYDEHLMIRKTRNISPFLNWKMLIDKDSGNGIWYEGNSEYAAFYWNMSTTGQEPDTIEFSVVIHADGRIKFFYPDNEDFVANLWAGGISNGDGTNYHFISNSGNQNKSTINNTLFSPVALPYEMELSQEGLFSGKPAQNYYGVPLTFEIRDYKNMVKRKTLNFYSFVAGIGDRHGKIAKSITITPNPVHHSTVIRFYLHKKTLLDFILVDMKGKEQLVLKGDFFHEGINKQQIDFSTVNPGVYFILIRSDGRMIGTEKVIKL